MGRVCFLLRTNCPQIQSEGTCSNCLAISFNTHFCLERLVLVVDALNQMSSHVVYLYNFTMFIPPLYPEIWALHFWPSFASPLLFTRMHSGRELP